METEGYCRSPVRHTHSSQSIIRVYLTGHSSIHAYSPIHVLYTMHTKTCARATRRHKVESPYLSVPPVVVVVVEAPLCLDTHTALLQPQTVLPLPLAV